MSGKKYDEGKIRYDLIPPEAKRAMAAQFTHGAEKYGDRNWEEGLHFGRLVRAVDGHLTDWWAGEDLDEEGRPHLHGALTSLAMLVSLVERHPNSEWDNRPVKVSRPDVIRIPYVENTIPIVYNPEVFQDFEVRLLPDQNPHISPVETSVNSAETDQSTGGNGYIHKIHFQDDISAGPLCGAMNYRRYSGATDDITCRRCKKLIKLQ